ncbi:MAG: hypothetical protein DMG21_06255, partial [Acidobacteria bacterium]
MGLAPPSGHLILEAENGRVDFKVGADKKPFAVTNVAGRLDLDLARGRVSFRLAGEPIRTDMSLPTPGQVQLEGDWTPGENLSGPLTARVQTRGALLYDWVPFLTGRNPGLYGLVDARADLRGSIYSFQFEGSSVVRQLRRWELPPPADSMPASFTVRGQFNRAERGRVVLESAQVSFRGSTLHASGNIEQAFESPRLDLAVAVERSRLEDFFQLERRFTGGGSTGLTGRVDGLVTVRGPWREPSLNGFFKGHGAHLAAGGSAFPVSDIDLRVDESGARLAPLHLTLAPRVELVAEGAIRSVSRRTPPTERSMPRSSIHRSLPVTTPSHGLAGLQYSLALSTKGLPLHDLVRFGRSLGMHVARELDANGTAIALFELTGNVWPLGPPAWRGQAELRGARFFLPGLTEPLDLPHARVEINENKIVADPVTAVIGASVFTGRLEHEGSRNAPWDFNVRTPHLSLE